MKIPAQGPITQGFTSTHLAVDIGGDNGAYFDTPIVAPHAGTITAAGQMGSGTNDAGLAIDITSADGRYKSRLAHNNQILVSVGQAVTEGQQVGTQGYTGYTQPDNTIGGTHCHWVLWDNGVRVDGRKYLTQGGNTLDDKDITAMYLAAGAATSEATKPENLNFWRGKKPESLANELYKGNELFRYKGSNYDKDVNLQSTDVDIMRILVTEIEGWDYDSTHGGQNDATLKKNLSGNPVKSVVRNMFANQTSQDYRKAKKAAFAGDADPKVLINGQEYIKK